MTRGDDPLREGRGPVRDRERAREGGKLFVFISGARLNSCPGVLEHLGILTGKFSFCLLKLPNSFLLLATEDF